MTAVTSSAPRAAMRRRGRRFRAGVSLPTIAAFLLPFGIPFLLFYILPVLYAMYQSLRQITRGGGQYGIPTESFSGLSQYRAVFANSEFWSSIGRMFLFGVIQVPLMLAIAAIIALLLDSKLTRAKSVFRLAAFLPYAVPGVIAAIMWSFLYHPTLSPIVDLLGSIGIHADFLAPGAVLWSIANISTWLWTGYNMLIIYSALQAIPPELYEAARIDGAGNLAIAWRIKLPIIRPALIMTTVFSIIGTLQLYSEPAVLQQVTTTVTGSFTPNMLVYQIAAGGNYQQAAAMSVVIALATFILSFGFMKIAGRRSAA